MNTPGKARIPSGLVTFFLDSTSPPAGWAASTAAGRMLLATREANNVGVTGGEPITDQASPTHDHLFNTTTAVNEKPTDDVECKDNQGFGTGNDKVPLPSSGATAPAETGLPFCQFLCCEATSGEEDAAEDDFPPLSVAFFNRSTPPPGWSLCDAGFEGRFVLPLPSNAVGLPQGGTPWNPQAWPTHVHGISGTIDLGDLPCRGAAGDSHLAETGSANVTGATDANASPVVPYLTLLLCVKNPNASSRARVEFPFGLSVFFQGMEPPTGWTLAPGSAGRFLFALPAESNAPGAAFGGDPFSGAVEPVSHKHHNTTKVIVPVHLSDIPGGDSYHLGGAGSHTLPPTELAGIELPYAMLLHIQPEEA